MQLAAWLLVMLVLGGCSLGNDLTAAFETLTPAKVSAETGAQESITYHDPDVDPNWQELLCVSRPF